MNPTSARSSSSLPSSLPRASSLVGQFMTRSPHSISPDACIATARERMRTHGIRHLPVVDEGRLVGVVSERDLSVIEGVEPDDAHDVQIRYAMASDVYAVSPETPLADAVEVMAERKIGCVVVAERGDVVGVFSAVDGLVLLHRLLVEGRP